MKDIRRQTRRDFSAEDKIRIVLDGLRGEDRIAELCCKEGIAQSLYYTWSKEFMEAGKRRLAGDNASSPSETQPQTRPAIRYSTPRSVPNVLTTDSYLYKLCKLVERFFSQIRQYCAVATRYEKHPKTISPSSNSSPPETGYALCVYGQVLFTVFGAVTAHALGRIVDISGGWLGQKTPEFLNAAACSSSPQLMDPGTGKQGKWFQLVRIGFGGIPGQPPGGGPDCHWLWPGFTDVPNGFLERCFPLRTERHKALADTGGTRLRRAGRSTLRRWLRSRRRR